MTKIEASPLGQLLSVASRFVTESRMQRAFAFAENNPTIFNEQLRELYTFIAYTNYSPLKVIPEDMIHARAVKQKMDESHKSLPSPLPLDTHRSPHLREQYRRMLFHGNNLLGSYFHFHERAKDDKQRLAASIMDGYSFFLSFHFGYKKPEDLKKFQVIACNAICEVLAHFHKQYPNGSKELYETAKELGWYNPTYGFKRSFLARHNLIG